MSDVTATPHTVDHSDLLTVDELITAAVAQITGPDRRTRGNPAATPTARTVRYYHEQGLLSPPAKARGRRYTHAHVDELVRILTTARAGHTLTSVRHHTQPAGSSAPTGTPPANGPRQPMTPDRWAAIVSSAVAPEQHNSGFLEGDLHRDMGALNYGGTLAHNMNATYTVANTTQTWPTHTTSAPGYATPALPTAVPPTPPTRAGRAPHTHADVDMLREGTVLRYGDLRLIIDHPLTDQQREQITAQLHAIAHIVNT
jgi:hypothetical protein